MEIFMHFTFLGITGNCLKRIKYLLQFPQQKRLVDTRGQGRMAGLIQAESRYNKGMHFEALNRWAPVAEDHTRC